MSDIISVNGIGPKKINLLSKLNITSLNDALKFYPRTYEDRTIFVDTRTCQDGQKACLPLIIASVTTKLIRKGMEITKILAVDDFGACEITLFNQKYLAKSLKTDKLYVFYGVINKNLTRITMNSPTIEPFSKTSSRILPIYNLTSGISQNDIRKVTYQALQNTDIPDILPQLIKEKYKFSDINKSLQQIHFPKNLNDVHLAKRRIIFEQMFLYFLKLQFLHQEKRQNLAFKLKNADFSQILDNLSYELTNAQLRSINECISDMKTGFQMSRLLQGDVGSGKTIVATILSYLACKNSKQVAFMVPTEILANQHFDEISELFTSFSLKTALLTGSTTAKNKRIIKEQLKNGEIDIVIGTHAIITDDTEFNDLGLVIVDEQHRFGVMQRAKLTAKGENPHILVMSATPIPRTLSLILYGDLELSIIDEMPKGRKPVDTFIVDEPKRKRMYHFIKQHIDQKEQVYIVCPLVSESENSDAKDAEQYFENICKLFNNYSIGLIHGKMKSKEKDAVMERFSGGEIDILVSTTVIEVGVNVPNATIMVVENAERFGLFALHQLRGRVGRGSKQSYCLLFSSNKSARLEILTKTNDGFEIAQEDLKIRGAGDFFGVRQSGASTIDILSDEMNVKILKYANLEAVDIINRDPTLENYPYLKKIIDDDLVTNKLNIFT
ncbi:MAG: ATP-dependent DNA helicase RecG [Clostridia bacterium]